MHRALVRRRPGFAALVTILVILAAGSRSTAAAQISPGPLARPHSSLEGATNCIKCHGPRRESMNTQCLGCHREIAWLTERNRGFHAAPDRKGRRCAECHPDHAGAELALIEWPGGSRDRFDHALAGWALDGSHVKVKCEGCHTAGYRVSPAASLSPRRAGSGWTGLETSCASCHQDDDVHRGALRATCESCHDTRAWQPAPGFAHDTTDYPLTGKHATTECNACHLNARTAKRRDAAGQLIPVYAPLAFASCADCHEDPHAGRFTTACADCHRTTGFTTGLASSFNHARTRYPLKGKHARVTCAACHGNDLARPKPAFASCESCHSDPHGGEAVLNGQAVDCGACHRVEGFAPSTYSVTQHASSRYPLEGRHAAVACAKCHAKAPPARGQPAVARLRIPFEQCASCHADSHAGQLAAQPGRGGCERCHVVSGFAPSTFSRAAHDSLRVSLDGAHAELLCRACHGGERPGLPEPLPRGSLGTAGVAVALPAGCASCHVDPHAGRYADGGAGPTTADCTSCHSTTAFRPSRLGAQDHDRFGVPLEGAHQAVACVACHEELRAAPAGKTLLLSARDVRRFPAGPATNRTCATCHDNPHGGQFGARATTCEACHGLDAFAPAARFDHDRDATFALRGAHAAVPCARCHVPGDANGKRTVAYRPLDARCESCHDKGTP